MGQIFAYSIVTSIILAALYLIYKLMMSGEKEFVLNRYTLLGIYIIAIATPAILSNNADTAIENTMIAEVLPMSANENIAGMTYAPTAVIPYTPYSSVWPAILISIYMVGMVTMIILTLITWIRLIKMVADGEKISYGRYIIVINDNISTAPFSWYRYIIMNREDSTSANAPIIAHELSHLRHFHWIDLIVAQAMIVFNWFNPAAWLMREELKTVHEYQADLSVIKSGADIKEYQLLLIKKAVGSRFPSLTNSLNHSKLKKRITMMMKNRPEKKRRMRALALVPAVAAALVVINTPVVARTVGEIRSTSTEDFYDTGHKGTNLSVEEEHSLVYSSKKTDAPDTADQPASQPSSSPVKKETDKYKWTVRGTVTTTTGDPMTGVIIKVNDKSTGVTTDSNGKFTIKTDKNDNIQVLYPDYEVVSVSESNDNGNNTLVYVMDGPGNKKSSKTTVTTITGQITLYMDNKNNKETDYEWYLDGKRISAEEISELAPGQIKEIRIYETDGKKKGYITLN